MDFDIEMEDAVVEAYPVEETVTQSILPEEDEQEPGEVDESTHGATGEPDEQTLVPTKIHIRGLDTFKEADIKTYVQEHYGTYDRVQWIDDTSANLLFRTESSATEALVALSAVEIVDATQLPPLELIPAKPFAAKPDSSIRVRFAVEGDRKVVGAASRSRFYLLNPEFDPEERRRRGEFDRHKYRDRDNRGYGRQRNDRWDDDAPEAFDASLYDDDEAALAKRAPRTRRRGSRSRSRSSGSDSGRRAQLNRDKELFPEHKPRDKELFPDHITRDRIGRPPRHRSASPARSADDRMDRDDGRDRAAASRNRDHARSIKERLQRDLPKDNSSKELFPSKDASGLGKAQMDQVDPADNVTKRLSARLTPATIDRITRPSDGGGFNIRGMAAQRSSDQGLAIKGGASARELFPGKLNDNAGKELFSDKLENRIRPRQKAQDLFY